MGSIPSLQEQGSAAAVGARDNDTSSVEAASALAPGLSSCRSTLETLAMTDMKISTEVESALQQMCEKEMDRAEQEFSLIKQGMLDIRQALQIEAAARDEAVAVLQNMVDEESRGSDI